jgi:hypothetical protein
VLALGVRTPASTSTSSMLDYWTASSMTSTSLDFSSCSRSRSSAPTMHSRLRDWFRAHSRNPRQARKSFVAAPNTRGIAKPPPPRSDHAAPREWTSARRRKLTKQGWTSKRSRGTFGQSFVPKYGQHQEKCGERGFLRWGKGSNEISG